MEFGSRLQEVLKEKNMTNRFLAEQIEENASAVTSYLNGHRKPKVEFIFKVVRYFPDLDLNWLFRGIPLEQDQKQKPEAVPEEATPEKIIDEIQKKINDLRDFLPQE